MVAPPIGVRRHKTKLSLSSPRDIGAALVTIFERELSPYRAKLHGPMSASPVDVCCVA